MPGLSVRSVGLDDPGQGVGDDVLDGCRGAGLVGTHPPGGGRARGRPQGSSSGSRRGRSRLIALHSAHWSTPFMEAMNERSRLDVVKAYRPGPGVIRDVRPPQRNTLPKADSRVTPYVRLRKFPEGSGGIDRVEAPPPLLLLPRLPDRRQAERT